jgi:glycosyltransferase involved in cell wall biosynthesis
LAKQSNIEGRVTFISPQERESMPALYGTSDILLFTSIWHEPFGRVLVEAMAAGVAVIGTATGGASEIIADGENGLLFPPDNAAALAERIAYLQARPELRARLTATGRRDAIQKFDSGRMVSEIEKYLESVTAPVNGRSAA